jgi:hypothetical protein
MRSSGYQKNKQFVEINQIVTNVVSKLRKSMNKPIQNFRDRGVDVAVWPNKSGGYSFTFRKTYKNKQTGEYVETKYFYKEECERLIELLQEAVKYASGRAEHDVNHIASGGYTEKKVAAKHEDDVDLDSLPF